MSKPNNTSSKIKQIITDLTGLDDIADDHRLDGDHLDLDHLSLCEIRLEIETEFSIFLPEDEELAGKTVADLVKLVDRLVHRANHLRRRSYVNWSEFGAISSINDL
jgi:acyl carrier protein